MSCVSCSALPERITSAEAQMETAAVHSAAAQLKLLLTEVEAQQAILATPFDGWSTRLDSLTTVEDLVEALRDIERELNGLGDGLPRGMHSPNPSQPGRSIVEILTSTVVQHGLKASFAYNTHVLSTLPASCSPQCITAEHELLYVSCSSCTPLGCTSSGSSALGCRCQG